jgi:hypothetical protein
MLTQLTLGCYTQGHKNQFINSETWCVSELYWSYLKKYDTKTIKKCNINIRDDWEDLIGDYTNYSDVAGIKLEFNFLKYFQLDKHNKKMMQLDAIHRGMLIIAEKEGWETEKLEEAYRNCLEINLEYKFFINKPKLSPNRKYKVILLCDWDLDNCELFWVLYDNKSLEIKRKKLVEMKSSDGEIVYSLKCIWLNNLIVRITCNNRYSNKVFSEFSIDIN